MAILLDTVTPQGSIPVPKAYRRLAAVALNLLKKEFQAVFVDYRDRAAREAKDGLDFFSEAYRFTFGPEPQPAREVPVKNAEGKSVFVEVPELPSTDAFLDTKLSAYMKPPEGVETAADLLAHLSLRDVLGQVIYGYNKTLPAGQNAEDA